jgi:hypothetical protein
MNKRWNHRWLIRLSLVSAGTLVAALLVVSWNKKTQAQNHTPVPMTTDWSNRHMVYSTPSSMLQAWRLQFEPRYLDQRARRNAPAAQAQGAQ